MRIVLEYSGGPEASTAVHWLRETHRADVVGVTLDLGQGRALEAVRDRALADGAVRAHVVDARDEFIQEFVLRTLRADAVLDGGCPDPRALGRPLLGRALVEIARIERAVAVAHCCDHDDADRRRVESAVQALNPGLTMLRVPREARPEPCTDTNVWGRTLLTTGAFPESAFVLTKPLRACPDEPAIVELDFVAGSPTSINGVAMPALDLIQSLGTIAGSHGIGRCQTAGGWVEAPAAVVLHEAHRALRARISDPELEAFSRTVSQRYANIVDQGGWFFPLREALDGFVQQAQRAVTGSVRLRLFKTACERTDESSAS